MKPVSQPVLGTVSKSASSAVSQRTFPRRAPATFLTLLAFLLAALAAPPLCAQQSDATLSDAEVDQIRDARLDPPSCILLFVKFLDLRTKEIHDLFAHPRQPGREQDTHDLIEQFTAIADELDDNLDDYNRRHVDIRKALPKVLDAADRWSTDLKSPPDDQAYSVSRKIALESIGDLRDAATQLTTDQAAWFKAHPPPKASDKDGQDKDSGGVYGPITIPR